MKVSRDMLRKMFAAWNRLSPSVEIEPPAEVDSKKAEQWVRLEWTRRQLAFGGSRSPATGNRQPLTSWNDLNLGEAKHLLRTMNEESGDGPAHRAIVIAKLAADLWPGHWDEFLQRRLEERFGFNYRRAEDLEPRDARTMIEELLSRIARRDGVTVDAVRERVVPRAMRKGSLTIEEWRTVFFGGGHEQLFHGEQRRSKQALICEASAIELCKGNGDARGEANTEKDVSGV